MTNQEDGIDRTETGGLPPTQTQEHTPSPGAAGIPKRIGQYRIKRAIASGGMGTVYEALQEKPRRTVALKLMRAGIASRSALRRFEYESQLLARLRHPGIAQVYDAGTHKDGEVTVPYFAMEYIVGAKAVTDYAKDKKLGTRESMKLFSAVCEAVHHGHQKGIIHRDLKPSNILVDSSGQVKIIDFGVARCTDSDMAVTTLQTDVGQLIGTLQYMSPEQCAADPHDIDTRSDVYALGVVFYEMLCERLPYDLKGTAIHEATRIIREQEPTRLSTLNRTLRGDVETIVLKALEKDRDRRYRSCIELSDDLGRYLRNEPISARPASAMYQFKKLISRHKAPFCFVVVLFLLISGFGVWMSVMYTRADGLRLDAVAAEQEQARARKEAEEARDTLETVTEFQQSMLSDIDAETMGRGIIHALREGIGKGLEQKEDLTPQEVETSLAPFDRLIGEVNATNLALKVVDEYVLARAVETIHKDFADQPLVRADLEQTVADTYRKIGLYDPAMPLQAASLETRRRVLGNDHPDTLISINNMGVLLLAMGKLDEAEPYYREALEGNRRVLGDDHPFTLFSISNMGDLLQAMGKLDEAEPYSREALEGNRRLLGDEHPSTLISIHNMGRLMRNLGRLEEAETLGAEAVRGARAKLPHSHPFRFGALGQHGRTLAAMEQFVEAEAALLEAYDGFTNSLGPEHRRTAGIVEALLDLYESWHAAEPGKGYDAKAAEWRAKVPKEESKEDK
ncbi:MAG: serine/threonine protein kinase [Planctomycetes bacterium]|nr:serine/threonine protein kinase [Planctomycetota bacterium]